VVVMMTLMFVYAIVACVDIRRPVQSALPTVHVISNQTISKHGSQDNIHAPKSNPYPPRIQLESFPNSPN
jgi:hypothetical protein